jgi:hypothetical protein
VNAAKRTAICGTENPGERNRDGEPGSLEKAGWFGESMRDFVRCRVWSG